MASKQVNVAEGKKHFSRLIQEAHEKKGKFIITRRGKPVAAIVSYEEFQQSKRREGYKKIMEAREHFIKSGVSADEVYKESRKQLEKKK